VPDEQQAPVRGDAGHRVDRLRGVEASRQRRMDPQQLARVPAQAINRQLRRLACPHLRAEQDRLEDHLQASERDPRRARLRFAAPGQAPLAVLTSAVRLRVCVSE